MKKKPIRIVLHILAWLLLLGLPLNSSIEMKGDLLLVYYTFAIINGVIFYTNYLFLVPGFFFRKKKYRYYLSAAALMICFYFVSDISGKQLFRHLREEGKSRMEMARDQEMLPLPPPDRPPGRLRRFMTGAPQVMGYLSSASFMIFLSLGLRVLERQSKIERMQEEMEKEKLNAELALLKNQVSPHFFFNTLNNIYSLIGINAEDSQKAVLKLSKLMRYLLYETEHGDTKLVNEIDFMKNYIDLMKLRMSEKVSLTADFPEGNENVTIPPLLFVPFIENAFKHGISARDRSFISISLSVLSGVLTFDCRNSIARKRPSEKQPGIGLGNVRKRLALLFPGRHDLIIEEKDNEFRVHLEIKLT